MIPRRLRLLNFLSYKDCEIDMSGLRLAVLSGRNGDGKSALLDAMIWALWGKGRGGSDDERIRIGADHVLVEFEFEVGKNIYRVVRRRPRGKTGALDFFQQTEMGWAAVTGGVMTQTQAEINAHLRMDHETFENSAFIAQGRANEFTKRTPAKRKEVFRKILGLELYEDLSREAGERRKSTAADAERARTAIAGDEERLARLPEVMAAIEATERDLAVAATAIAETASAVAELHKVHAVFERLERELEALHRQQDEAEAAIRREEAAAAIAVEEGARLEALRKGEAELRARHAELVAFRAEDEDLQAHLLERRRLERDIETARGEVAAEAARLTSRRDALSAEAERLREAAAELPALEAALGALDDSTAQVAAIRTKVREAEDAAGVHREAGAAADAEMRRCKDENATLHARREELLRVQKDGGEAICPLCRQALDPRDLGHVLDEYTAQKKALGERHNDAAARLKAATAAAAAASAGALALAAQADSTEREIQRDRNALTGRLGGARAAADSLPRREEELGSVVAEIAGGTFAAGAREALEEAEAALERTVYDPERHAAVRAALGGWDEVEKALREAAAAGEHLQALAGQEDERGKRLAELRARLRELVARAAEVSTEIETAEDVAPRLKEAEAALASGQQRHGELQMTSGRLSEQRRQLEDLAARTEEARARAGAFAEEAEVYGDLSKAFGRDGVQAMLMSQAMPRLEFIANAMLDRMTGGRITVQLKTTKDTKSGGTQDTLDIRISDEVGTRDYEMYSGGEAFRVDFALRIALARLLAERAGADLATLIIDEGFGSQDQDGIDRLVDAINSVSEDFRLILVVTHVEELRNRFEQRIDVTKDFERGSFARVA